MRSILCIWISIYIKNKERRRNEDYLDFCLELTLLSTFRFCLPLVSGDCFILNTAGSLYMSGPSTWVYMKQTIHFPDSSLHLLSYSPLTWLNFRCLEYLKQLFSPPFVVLARFRRGLGKFSHNHRHRVDLRSGEIQDV